YTCTNATATQTVNGKTFNNVYHITFMFQLNAAGGGWTNVSSPINYYYAKGIGLIWIDYPAGSGEDQLIRSWQVN
ncbi:MAG TPA: hypothetical protein VM871_01500, partial [Flavisolibacter sp.]|nr:hypothetical protein [Flavisolibacter sp.]